MNKFTFVFMAVTALTFQSCATHEQRLQESGAIMLSPAALEILLSTEGTIDYWTPRGPWAGVGSISYYPDGTQKITTHRGTDNGRYSIQEEKLCSMWQMVNFGKVNCVKIYQTHENRYDWVRDYGSYGGTFSFR